MLILSNFPIFKQFIQLQQKQMKNITEKSGTDPSQPLNFKKHKEFRIKSASKDKNKKPISLPKDLYGSKTHRKHSSKADSITRNFRAARYETQSQEKNIELTSVENTSINIENYIKTEECVPYQLQNSSIKKGSSQKITKICIPKRMLKVFNTINASQIKPKGKSNKNLKPKQFSRVNQLIFEKAARKRCMHQRENTHESFWNQVNESLILASATFEQDENSKDLRDLMQNLHTE